MPLNNIADSLTEEPRGEILKFESPEKNNESKHNEPWIKDTGPGPLVWPDDHSYRDALVVTPEGEENITINEGYYCNELTHESLVQINAIREKLGKIIRVVPTRYSRVSESTALFNGA